jgi:hypothetical protein
MIKRLDARSVTFGMKRDSARGGTRAAFQKFNNNNMERASSPCAAAGCRAKNSDDFWRVRGKTRASTSEVKFETRHSRPFRFRGSGGRT